jgi:hypothetical protein
MPQGLKISSWMDHGDALTTHDNIVDVWTNGALFKDDVFISLVNSDRQHGEFVTLSGESGRYYMSQYELFVRSR